MEKIIVKTIYTKENFLEFQKFHYLSNVTIPRFIFTLFGILFGILGIFGFIYEDYFFGVIELVLGILLIIEFNTALIPMIQAKRILKSDSMLIGLENTFTFFEDHMEAFNKRSTSNVFYNELFCYKESKDFFYIYLNKMSAFLVDKRGVFKGTIKDLEALLKMNVKRK